jgi:hypothetical protein
VYKEAVWPAPIVLTGVALIALLFSFSQSAWASRAVLISLAVLWAWTAGVYHFTFFSRINHAALAFAILWASGAAAFAAGAVSSRGRVRPHSLTARILGGALVVYALLIYPVLGSLIGHSYPAAPTFGTPCPVAIFTLGVLSWHQVSGLLFIPALLWSFIGGSAAFLLGVPQDMGLLIAGLLAGVLVFSNRMQRASAT